MAQNENNGISGLIEQMRTLTKELSELTVMLEKITPERAGISEKDLPERGKIDVRDT